MAIVLAGGVTPDKTNEGQVLAALRQMFGGANTQSLGTANNGLQLTETSPGLILLSAAGGSFSITLPLAARPQLFRFVRVDTQFGNTVTINAHSGGDTIDGVSSITVGCGETRELTAYTGANVWITSQRGVNTPPAVAQIHYASSQTLITTTSTSLQNSGVSISVTKKRATNKIVWTGYAAFTNDTTISGAGALGNFAITYDTGGGPNVLDSAPLVGAHSPGLINSQFPASAAMITQDNGGLAQAYTARIYFKSNAGDQFAFVSGALMGIESWAP